MIEKPTEVHLKCSFRAPPYLYDATPHDAYSSAAARPANRFSVSRMNSGSRTSAARVARDRGAFAGRRRT